MNGNTALEQGVMVVTGVFSRAECNDGVRIMQSQAWSKHEFNNEASQSRYSYDDDLDVSHATASTEGQVFASVVMERLYGVLAKYAERWQLPWNGYSRVRFNRYAEGTCMHRHWDSIYTLFDGKVRGIPMLSIVGLLNDDYEGGEFVMWDDTVIPIPKGAVLVFPSTFLYSHEVRTVTKGERLSFVSWAW